MKAFVLAALLFSLPALAADIKMLDVQSDVDGDLKAELAIQVKADTTIENIVYKNPTKPTETYDVGDLNQDKETLVKKSGVAVVQISAETITNNSLFLDITYLYKYGVFGSDRRVKRLKMYYEAPTNLYHTIDTDTKQVVTRIFVVARMDGSKAKGVDHIETYP